MFFYAIAFLALHGSIILRPVSSFQLQRYPESTKRKALTRRNVGFGFPSDPSTWSDVKPHDAVTAPAPPSLSPLASAWTKYSMIAYVAHMCAFLPLSLVPTLLQTKLGMHMCCLV